ncbi:MAG TPA: radical SAM protein, partial [Candidatus Bilamarchaeaceae archaeon]|nr:radical SAM protein [Candidatus Bilamarchaeaceae archaeon]
DRFNVALVAFSEILEKEGHEIHYFSDLSRISDDVEHFAASEKPDIIFFGCSHSSSFGLLESISEKVKAVSPGTLTVAGGQYVAGAQTCPPCVDILAKGEGFIPFYFILNEEPGNLMGSRRIITRADAPRPVVSEFHSKYEAFPYLNLDHLDFMHMPAGRVYFQMGCLPKGGRYSACKFCGSINVKMHRVARNFEKVLQTISELVSRFNTQHIFLGEEDLLCNREAAEAVVSALERWRKENPGVNLTFSAQARVEKVCWNPDLVERFAIVGMKEMQLGIESCSQGIVDAFGGKHLTKLIETALRILRCARMQPLGHILIGLPGETVESIGLMKEKVSDWMGRGLLSFPEMRYPIFYKGTEFGNHPEKYGIRILEKDPKLLVGERGAPTFEYDRLSRQEMAAKMKEFFAEVNRRFRQRIEANPGWRAGAKRTTPF